MKDRHEHPSIATLCKEIDREKLILQPIFQRKYIWKPGQQREFMKWILEGKPIPSVIFSKFDGKRCVLDGQQRLTTIHRYRHGKFSVNNKYYDDLSEDMKEDFKDYNVAVQEFVIEDGDSDFDVINTFSVLNAGQQLSLGEKVYALETIYPIIALTKQLFFPASIDQENQYHSRRQRWIESLGEIFPNKRKKEYEVFVPLVISGLVRKAVSTTKDLAKMKGDFEFNYNNDYTSLLMCMDEFIALSRMDTTNYLKPKQKGIPRLADIAAPWTSFALPETHSLKQQITAAHGDAKEMWKEFFLQLSQHKDLKDTWDKKIKKKISTQIEFVLETLS